MTKTEFVLTTVAARLLACYPGGFNGMAEAVVKGRALEEARKVAAAWDVAEAAAAFVKAPVEWVEYGTAEERAAAGVPLSSEDVMELMLKRDRERFREEQAARDSLGDAGGTPVPLLDEDAKDAAELAVVAEAGGAAVPRKRKK